MREEHNADTPWENVAPSERLKSERESKRSASSSAHTSMRLCSGSAQRLILTPGNNVLVPRQVLVKNNVLESSHNSRRRKIQHRQFSCSDTNDGEARRRVSESLQIVCPEGASSKWWTFEKPQRREVMAARKFSQILGTSLHVTKFWELGRPGNQGEEIAVENELFQVGLGCNELGPRADHFASGTKNLQAKGELRDDFAGKGDMAGYDQMRQAIVSGERAHKFPGANAHHDVTVQYWNEEEIDAARETEKAKNFSKTTPGGDFIADVEWETQGSHRHETWPTLVSPLREEESGKHGQCWAAPHQRKQFGDNA
ncbi:hypothetical protein B0H11DRAFT_1909296 [Mycena galericulata]|nr:hypothetical protein B0H11DRAFT_1909296 [Mycena galericulata]